MAQISSFLRRELFQFGDSPVTVAQLLSVPIAIFLILGLARVGSIPMRFRQLLQGVFGIEAA